MTKMKEVDLEKHGDDFDGVTFIVNDVHDGEDLKNLKEIIKENPGESPVRIIIHKKNDKKLMMLNHKVDKNEKILECIKKFSAY